MSGRSMRLRPSPARSGASGLAFGHLCLAVVVSFAIHSWFGASGAAMAQGAPKQERKKANPAAAQQQTSPRPKLPDPYKLNLLIRSTILAVDQANRTGNYTVLRDLASPKFQKANSKAKLAEIFAGLRKRKLDLSPVMLFDPKLVTAPAIDAGGMLRLTGFIPTQPEQILFDFAFEFDEGKWRLFGIALDVRPPAKSPQKPKPPAGAK